jgi:hypothetical protein
MAARAHSWPLPKLIVKNRISPDQAASALSQAFRLSKSPLETAAATRRPTAAPNL